MPASSLLRFFLDLPFLVAFLDLLLLLLLLLFFLLLLLLLLLLQLLLLFELLKHLLLLSLLLLLLIVLLLLQTFRESIDLTGETHLLARQFLILSHQV